MESFRIYYADGSVYGSGDGPWDAAPADGVLVVALKDGGRVQYNFGSDYYARIPESETYVRLDSLEAFARQYVPQVKFGVWVAHERFEETLRRAQNDFGEPTVGNPHDG